MTMNNSSKMNHADFLSISKDVDSLSIQAAFLDTALAELFENDCENFSLDAAGAVLTGLEDIVFQLRSLMFIIHISTLSDDGDALKDSIIDLAADVCAMRDKLMDFLDEIFADSDEELNEALAEIEAGEDDVFHVRVPVDSEIKIDGEPYNFAGCADEYGVVAIPIVPGETLTVDGERVNTDGCETGGVYSIIDGKSGEDKENGGDAGEELADNEFLVWAPIHSTIMVNGKPLTVPEDILNEDTTIRLILCEGDTLTVDGSTVDLSTCEPGMEYDLTAAD